MPDHCFCCRPDCYECNPDLWMARVNADFAANWREYEREYDEAEAVPLTQEELDQMEKRTWEMIRESERKAEARKRIAGAN